jgi:hypothetical protein
MKFQLPLSKRKDIRMIINRYVSQFVNARGYAIGDHPLVYLNLH